MDIDSAKRMSEDTARDFLRRGADRRARRGISGPTAFLVDPELVVQDAEGESILRLPWFDEGLFVGRQLPDISEMPAHVRSLAVGHYRAALAGEAAHFDFVSYGQAFSVDAVPVHGDDGRVTGVLGIATPSRKFPAAATAYTRMAERLEQSAEEAERVADRCRATGHVDAELKERDRAERWRQGAERAWAHARWVESGRAEVGSFSLTPREADVLVLTSHGLTSGEIAEQLFVSRGTVRSHLEKIYLKLGVGDRAAAVATALRHGLID
jgi:DNA-binding CsgD family transcriptional regulator